jgi:hypothetical protein
MLPSLSFTEVISTQCPGRLVAVSARAATDRVRSAWPQRVSMLGAMSPVAPGG